MKPTIRNKLLLGFSGMLLLMAAIAGIGIYAVFSLRHSAQETTRIGDRLNAIAIEIQVHNLEAQRKAKSYFEQRVIMGEESARETYLDEADFEVHDIESSISKAVAIAPSEEIRARFRSIGETLKQYIPALDAAVKSSQKDASSAETKAALDAYADVAERLHEKAEDGEIAGREVAQTFQEQIDRTSKQSVFLVISFSVAGLILALTVSFGLARAILVPVAHLREVAENVSMGNLNISVHRHSQDEIGDLADSFSRMVTAVKFFRMEADEAQAAAAGRES
ncbi:MAG TPA: HAMP domain-containing protein [Acidobacteriaceae bacterium]|nr:HAMP domain-containing protein [Acidobacteriaceae bacterium]